MKKPPIQSDTLQVDPKAIYKDLGPESQRRFSDVQLAAIGKLLELSIYVSDLGGSGDGASGGGGDEPMVTIVDDPTGVAEITTDKQRELVRSWFARNLFAVQVADGITVVSRRQDAEPYADVSRRRIAGAAVPTMLVSRLRLLDALDAIADLLIGR